MANNFTITISAADKATATIRKINSSMDNTMGKLTRPLSQIGKSWKSVGKEVLNNPIPRAIGNIASMSARAAKGVSELLTPMTALAGVGTIAGILSLAESWGRAGINVTNAAARIGDSVGELQNFRGVATAAGLSADGMQSSLVALGDTLQDALYGRNQQALIMLNRLGITIKKNKDGVVDTTQAMYDIADAIQKINNPQVQALVAKQFGLEGMLPVLRKGADGLREYQGEVKNLIGDSEAATRANKKFGDSWNELKLAFQGFENKVSASPILGMLTDIVQGWTYILSGGKVNPRLEEEKRKESNAKSSAINAVPQNSSLATFSVTSNPILARESYKFWRQSGLTHAQATGLVANEQRESDFNPNAVGDHGAARGIFQWHADRQKSILNSTGIDIGSASHMDQLKAALWEMKQRGDFSKILATDTPRDSGYAFSQNFERPAGGSAEANARGMLADQLSRRSLFTDLGKQIAENAPTQTPLQATLHVDFKNVPTGAAVSVSSPNHDVMTTARVDYSMNTALTP